MKLKTILLLLASLAAFTFSLSATKPYEPDWTSLRRHNTPEWMEDMKFGIYSHWGAQTAILASGDD